MSVSLINQFNNKVAYNKVKDFDIESKMKSTLTFERDGHDLMLGISVLENTF